jgi:hypothetical protein
MYISYIPSAKLQMLIAVSKTGLLVFVVSLFQKIYLFGGGGGGRS